MKVTAEYTWIDGTSPTKKLRSKTKVLDWEQDVTFDAPDGITLANFPDWGFDGSSTNQAEGHDSDCVLRPVCVVQDPIRRGTNVLYDHGGIRAWDDMPNYLVLCEVFCPDGVTPHPTNTRAKLREVLDAGASLHEPWFGIEQEYTLFTHEGHPLGFPDRKGNRSQGSYYCGVGIENIYGRGLYETHLRACIDAGLLYEGGNWEVAPGQGEFQIGSGDPLTVSDHLWIARWLIHRLGEDQKIRVSFDPKPLGSKFNGAGAHANFSTAAMRTGIPMKTLFGYRHEHALIPLVTDVKFGMAAIKAACEKLRHRHQEHVAVYGADNHLRLTGKHETCDIHTFRYGVADRGASIRIPRHVATKGYGYLEDRRPAANADPYEVMTRILKTVCLGE